MSPRLGLYQRKQGSGSPKALGHGIRDQNGVAPGPGGLLLLVPSLASPTLATHSSRPGSCTLTGRTAHTASAPRLGEWGAGQCQSRKGSLPLLLPPPRCSTVTLGPARGRAGGGDRWHG